MNTTALPGNVAKFISKHGYEYKDLNSKKVIRSKSSFSGFKTFILLLLAAILIVGGFFFKLLFVLGLLVLLIPIVKYMLRKRYVYEFDIKKGMFEIKDFLSPGTKKIYPFREIKGVEVNHYISDGDASAFSDSNKEYNYEVIITVGSRQEYELFFFTEKEYNPMDQVVAIKTAINSWLNPVAA